MGLIPLGLLRAKILYTAKKNAPAKIQASPEEKCKVSNIDQLPLPNKKRMPAIQSKSPHTRKKLIFSFKKMAASMIEKTGEEVVPMSAKLIAGE